MAPAPLLASPSSVAFGNVLTGVNYAQTLILSNVGSTNLVVTQIAASGSGFGVAGFSLPLTLLTGQSASFAVTFESATYGSDYGAVSIVTNASGSAATVALSATAGATSVQLSASPASITFATTTIGVGATQNVMLSNSGNSTVSISSVSAAGRGFTVNSVPNVTLAPGQAVNVSVNFDPTAAGLAAGSVTVASNAPPIQIALSGTGVASGTPSVALSWNPSTSVVVGYYVYRGTGAGGSLFELSSGIIPSTSYRDTTVVSGQTYTYAVTSVDSSGVESVFSTSVTVTIP